MPGSRGEDLYKKKIEFISYNIFHSKNKVSAIKIGQVI